MIPMKIIDFSLIFHKIPYFWEQKIKKSKIRDSHQIKNLLKGTIFLTEFKNLQQPKRKKSQKTTHLQKLVPLLPQGTETYGFPYPGFGGQSFGSKSSKSWYGTRFLKFNQSCMFSVVEHQKLCFSCFLRYIMQITSILSRFPMPFWPLEPDAPLAFPTLLQGVKS